MRFSAAAVIIGVSIGGALAEERTVYMPAQGRSCVDRSRTDVAAWSCRGPAGYSVEFFDEGNLAAVTIRSPRAAVGPSSYSWRGAAKVFGDQVEWHLVERLPKSAVLRIWRTEADAEGGERKVQELVVFKIAPAASCRVGFVDARTPGANELARGLAKDVAAKECSQESESRVGGRE
jgi:hypothetical protein